MTEPTKLDTVRQAVHSVLGSLREPLVIAAIAEIRNAMRFEPHRTGAAIREVLESEGITSAEVKLLERLIQFGQSTHHHGRVVSRVQR